MIFNTKTSDKPLSLLFVVVILLFACNRDDEPAIPRITIDSPAQNQLFHIYDTINVKATVRADLPVTGIRVELTGDGFVPVMGATYLFPNGRVYNIDLDYPLTDNSLGSGTYYLLVRAENANSFKNEYRKILVEGEPMQLENAIILSMLQPGQIKVDALGASNILNTFGILSGDFSSSEINSKDHLLYISGLNNLNLLAFDLQQKVIAWKIDPVPSHPMHNKGCLYFDDILIAGYNWDYIHGYNAAGNVVFNSAIEDSDAPSRTFRSGDNILVDFQQKNTTQPFIKTLYYLTGEEKQRILTSFKVVNFHDLGNNKVLITANNSGSGEIWEYDIGNNVLTLRQTLAAKILNSVATSNVRFVVSTENRLYEYRADLLQFIQVGNLSHALYMAFDSLSGRLYTASDNELGIYKYPEMVNQKTFPFSDTILGLHLQYTK